MTEYRTKLNTQLEWDKSLLTINVYIQSTDRIEWISSENLIIAFDVVSERKYLLRLVMDYSKKFEEIDLSFNNYIGKEPFIIRTEREEANIISILLCQIFSWAAWNVPQIREHREDITVYAKMPNKITEYEKLMYQKLGFVWDFENIQLPEVRLSSILSHCVLGRKQPELQSKNQLTKYERASVGLAQAKERRAKELEKRMTAKRSELRSKRDVEAEELADLFSAARL